MGNAVGNTLVLACVERHTDEESKGAGCHSKLPVFEGFRGVEKEEGEGKKSTTENEKYHQIHIGHKKIRPNHAQCEGNDEANKRVVLPVHQRFFSSLMRASGFSAPNT